MEPISQKWIQNYVTSLLEVAKRLGPETVMGKTTVLRAEHVMDMAEAWKEHCERVKRDDTRD
jgi:hypothetical protein